MLTLGSKERFKRSRDVGCYLGLRPKRSESGDRDPQLGITKAGNIYLRSLLVECANHVLGPRGKDSTLRQWGLHLASRGGKSSYYRAIVAVARKLGACFIASGSRKSRTSHSTQQLPKDLMMFTVAQPRVPMTACRLGPSQGRPQTGSIDFSD